MKAPAGYDNDWGTASLCKKFCKFPVSVIFFVVKSYIADYIADCIPTCGSAINQWRKKLLKIFGPDLIRNYLINENRAACSFFFLAASVANFWKRALGKEDKKRHWQRLRMRRKSRRRRKKEAKSSGKRGHEKTLTAIDNEKERVCVFQGCPPSGLRFPALVCGLFTCVHVHEII